MNRSYGTVALDGHGPDRQAMGRARELPRHGPARLCADPTAGVYEMTSGSDAIHSCDYTTSVKANLLDDGVGRYFVISRRDQRCSRFRFHRLLGQRANPLARHIAIPLFKSVPT